MTRTLLATIILLTVLWPGLALGQLQCDQPTANAGEVRSGAPLTYRFRLVNTGHTPIEITGARTSCGCLKPHLDVRALKPGESGTLLLEVNTLTQPAGAQSWPVHITYRLNGAERELMVQLQGTIVTELLVQPAAMTFFSDQPLSHPITVTDTRSKPLRVTAVHADSTAVSARIADMGRDAQGHVTTAIRVEAVKELSEGRHDVTISLYTDDPAYPELKVPVSVITRVSQTIRALPSLVSVSAAPDRPVPTKIVLLHDRGDRPVILERVESDHPAVTCTWAQGPDTRATVRVRIDRSRVVGVSLNATLTVTITAPERTEVIIPVSCTLP